MMNTAWVALYSVAAISFAHQLYLHVTGAETSATLVGLGLAFGIICCAETAIEGIKK